MRISIYIVHKTNLRGPRSYQDCLGIHDAMGACRTGANMGSIARSQRSFRLDRWAAWHCRWRFPRIGGTTPQSSMFGNSIINMYTPSILGISHPWTAQKMVMGLLSLVVEMAVWVRGFTVWMFHSYVKWSNGYVSNIESWIVGEKHIGIIR